MRPINPLSQAIACASAWIERVTKEQKYGEPSDIAAAKRGREAALRALRKAVRAAGPTISPFQQKRIDEIFGPKRRGRKPEAERNARHVATFNALRALHPRPGSGRRLTTELDRTIKAQLLARPVPHGAFAKAMPMSDEDLPSFT